MLHNTQNQRTAQVIADSSIFSFSDYLQLACMTRRSVRLQAVAEGKVIGGVVIIEGEVWHAWHRHTEGPEAFRRVVLTESTVKVVPHRGVAPERTVQGNWERLLMDAAVAQDEQRHEEQGLEPSPSEQPAPRRATNTNWFDIEAPLRTDRPKAEPWAWGDDPRKTAPPASGGASLGSPSPTVPPEASRRTSGARLAVGVALCSLIVVGAIVSAQVLLGSDGATPRAVEQAQPTTAQEVDVQALSPMPPDESPNSAVRPATPATPLHPADPGPAQNPLDHGTAPR